MFSIDFSTNDVLRAIAVCKKFIKCENVTLNFRNNMIELSGYKNGSFYLEKLKDKDFLGEFKCTINLKLLQSFLSDKSDVKLTYDESKDASGIILSNKRNRIKLPTIKDEYIDEDDSTYDSAKEINPKILALINANIERFDFTSPMVYSPDTFLQVEVKDNKFRMCSMEYFYSALLEDTILSEDVSFNINLKQAFIFDEVFSKESGVRFLSTDSNVIIISKNRKLILPQIFNRDTCGIQEVISDMQENTGKEMALGYVKANTKELRHALECTDDFLRGSEANTNIVRFKIKDGLIVTSIEIENGSFDNALKVETKLRGEFEYSLNLKTLIKMVRAVDNEFCVLKFFDSRIVIKTGNMIYQLLRIS